MKKPKPTITKEQLSLLPNHKQIRFAIFCANQVIHLVPTEHKEVALKAIGYAELYLEGKASKEECWVAANAAYAAAAYVASATYYAANAAASAAADAAYTTAAAYYAANAASAAYYAATANAAAATYTASPKDKQNIIEAQWDLYDQLLNEDRIFEEIVLKA